MSSGGADITECIVNIIIVDEEGHGDGSLMSWCFAHQWRAPMRPILGCPDVVVDLFVMTALMEVTIDCDACRLSAK